MKFVSLKPSIRLVKVGLITFACALILPALDVVWSQGGEFWKYVPFLGLVFITMAAIIDLFISKKPPLLAIDRKLPNILSLYNKSKVHFAIANRSKESITLDWVEHIPNDWECAPYTARLTIEPGQEQQHLYYVTPHKRGAAEISGAYLRVLSFFQFWQVSWFRDHETQHKVYPNFTAISDLAGLHGSVNLQQSGLKKFNLRGSGMDFLQLRDYREGESLKQIDWRASSRFNRLISREFQEEKNQHIIIMLDAGRRMRVQDDQLSYFEHSLNALIMLSFTALKNGDNLSIQSFGAQNRWLTQVRGVKNVSRVMHHFYDLYPEKISSDYLGATQDLMLKHPKRSLVLLVTCLRDEDFDDLLVSIKLLQEKHLVAVISIQEPVYEELREKPIERFAEAINYASSTIIERNIAQNVKRLQHQGVIFLQTKASGLTPSLINSYLGIKKAGLL